MVCNIAVTMLVSSRSMACRRAFSLRIFVVVVAVLVTAAVLLALVSVGLHRVRHGARTNYDSSQLRGVMQGLILWQQNNGDSFPLPSEYDKANKTVLAPEPASKNTTAHIYSILIYSGFVSPELMISTLETNPNIRPCNGYAYEKPPTAVDPRHALWDPTFAVDFTNGQIGNASYAHQIPILRGVSADQRNRHPHWKDSRASEIPVLANRGPQLSGVTAGQPSIVNTRSRALGVHGPARQWQGQVAYGDCRVVLEKSMTPPGVVYQFNADGQTRPDVLFYDEPDSHRGINAYLGIFPKAGPSAADYVSIWD